MITRMIGETSATYKFTVKAVLKADQKVTVILPIICTALVWAVVSISEAFEHTALLHSVYFNVHVFMILGSKDKNSDQTIATLGHKHPPPI